jgi:hypothetical protein
MQFSRYDRCVRIVPIKAEARSAVHTASRATRSFKAEQRSPVESCSTRDENPIWIGCSSGDSREGQASTLFLGLFVRHRRPKPSGALDDQ